MTDDELDAIEARAQRAHDDMPGFNRCADDALALVAEVRRLRGVVKFADERLIGQQDTTELWRDYDEWKAML